MWTTEQVAEHLDLTVDDVYRTRRENKYPGNLGVRRGRRLMFDPVLVENPPEPETTNDPTVAVLWELQAQTRLLHQIIHEVRGLRDMTLETIEETTIEIEQEHDDE